jgi:WD40 repeat protein/energy-coupling factor transporter ATP-binding protein EcfA2
MKKLVVLTLDGDFYLGFRVSLAIGSDSALPDIELSNKELKLPPNPTLPNIYQDWYNTYRHLNGHRIKAKKQQISHVKFQSLKKECYQNAEIIKQNFKTWLEADSFRRIKEQCLTQLTPTDEVRVIIRTTQTQLRKLPWHLWDLFDYYPGAEAALSSLSSQRVKRSYRPNVRILIILGNSEGINVAEDEKLLKQYCQKAEIVVLDEPSPPELNEHLWDEKGWDILFFSGHSQTESAQGRIFLNRTDSLTMDDLREGLKTALKGGLQLAFFNSCDGLGIASELETLNIPQVIVMREPIPDKVAQQFLKYFFIEFTQGKSLYQSVNIARKKLQGLETEYPCASWLPVIVQKLLETPPTWQSLGAIVKCPYRGLAAFREEDAPFFYGREVVTQKLVASVKQKPFIAVIGASGSGKSSVVFAGLIPQLKQDTNHNWLIVPFRPGNNPFESLAQALAPLLPHSQCGLVGDVDLIPPTPLKKGGYLSSPSQGGYLSSPSQGGYLSSPSQGGYFPSPCQEGYFPPAPRGARGDQRLAELNLEVELKQNKRALQNLIETIITASPKSHLVVIADQFEELYTLCDNLEERNIFIDNLLNAVHNAPGFTLVLTLRAVFYGEALSYRPLADALEDAHFNLGAMNAQELLAAIEQPATILNVHLEEGLTQRLVDAVLESPNHLPLLEFTLTQLWQKQRQGWLTHQAYAEIGGVETALANHAEAIYAQLSTTDKEKVQQIFVQLVQPGETSTDIRRLATCQEIGEENWELVTRIADARLVVTNRNPVTGIETVEIIHEALIKNWRRLRHWMRVNNLFRRWQEQLRAAMRQWENSDKDEGALLRGKPLIDAREWLLQRATQMSRDEQSFIELSLELRHREQKQKNAARRQVVIALTLALVVALLLAGVALFQRQEAVYQRQEAVYQQQLAQVSEIKALNQTAKVLLKSGNEVEAFIPILKSIHTLDKLNTLDRKTKIRLLASVLEVLSQIRQYNHLEGYDNDVTSVNWSPDGELLASGSYDKTIKIWRRDGKLLQTLNGHKDYVFSVVFTPDSQTLITASFDNTITFWRYDSTTGLFANHHILTIPEKDELWALALTPDGNILATGTLHGKVKLWTQSGKLLKTIPAHSARIWSLSFSPDGKTFATASADKTVKLWNFEGKLLKTLQHHTDEVLSVHFSPDGNTLASGSQDKTLNLWDVATGQLLHTFDGHGDEVLDVRFSADGKLIASGGADDTVRVWSIEQKKPLYTFYGHGGKASEASFSPDSKTLATASADKAVKLWRLHGILPHFSSNRVSISADGKTVVTGNQDGIVTLRHRDGSLLSSFTAHQREIVKILFSPTANIFVTIGTDSQIKLWNHKGKLIKNWQAHQSDNNSVIPYYPVQDVSFSPDGKILASIGRFDKQVKLWDLEGTLLESWQTQDDLLTSINFSPDGNTLASAGDKTVKLWNLQGKLLQTLQNHQANISSVTFSHDGKIIASASADKTVKLWHCDTGKLLQTFPHHEEVYSISFSPDSQVLVSASGNKIYFWSLDGKLIYSLQGAQDDILEVNFSRDGNTIASVDIKNNVILWNLDIKDLQQRACSWFQDYLTNDKNRETYERYCNYSNPK